VPGSYAGQKPHYHVRLHAALGADTGDAAPSSKREAKQKQLAIPAQTAVKLLKKRRRQRNTYYYSLFRYKR
jgi:hypothetical protein